MQGNRNATGAPVKWVPEKVDNRLKKLGSNIRRISCTEGIKSMGHWRCTVCGETFKDTIESVLLRAAGKSHVECPNCGKGSHALNHGILDDMNETSAYILGVYWARGRTPGKHFSSRRCKFTSKSRQLLTHLATVMSTDHPVQKVHGSYYGYPTHYELNLISARIAKKIKSFGKRNDIHKGIPTKLLKPFLLGCLDTQGNVEHGIESDVNTYSTRIWFTADAPFISRLQKALGKLPSKRLMGHVHITHGKVVEFRIFGNFRTKTFLDWIYKDLAKSHPHLIFRGRVYMAWVSLQEFIGKVERLNGYIVKSSEKYRELSIGIRKLGQKLFKQHGLSLRAVIAIKKDGKPPANVRISSRITKDSKLMRSMMQTRSNLVEKVSKTLMKPLHHTVTLLNSHTKRAYKRGPYLFRGGREIRVPATEGKI